MRLERAVSLRYTLADCNRVPSCLQANVKVTHPGQYRSINVVYSRALDVQRRRHGRCVRSWWMVCAWRSGRFRSQHERLTAIAYINMMIGLVHVHKNQPAAKRLRTSLLT